MPPESAVDRAAQELRQLVFEGSLESGAPLREVALGDLLGVSRSTVREALSLLVAEGLAVREPHRGVSVAAPDESGVYDVMRARVVLEQAGARSWSSASTAARERLRGAVHDYERAASVGGSLTALNDAHLAVHLAIVGLTGSPRLLAMAEALMAELRVVLAQSDRVRDDAHAQAGSHSHLVALLEDGDDGAIAAELAAHLADAQTQLVDALQRAIRPHPR